MEEKLILDNINLIYFVLKKYNLYHLREEYYDIGMIGLVKGAKSFKENKKIKPSTYLIKCITTEILTHYRKQQAQKRNGEKKDISIYTSINKPSDNKELTLIDFIPSKENIEEDLIHREQLNNIYQYISNLKEKEKFIICSKFGILGYERLTQIEIAERIKLSQPQVCRIINKELDKLRRKYE